MTNANNEVRKTDTKRDKQEIQLLIKHKRTNKQTQKMKWEENTKTDKQESQLLLKTQTYKQTQTQKSKHKQWVSTGQKTRFQSNWKEC